MKRYVVHLTLAQLRHLRGCARGGIYNLEMGLDSNPEFRYQMNKAREGVEQLEIAWDNGMKTIKKATE